MENRNFISANNMNESNLAKLSKTDLIKLILSLKADQPRTYKPRPPKPTPRKSVKQMVTEYEDNIIPPPPEFRNNYNPTPLPRTKIELVDKALKGYTKSFEISIKFNKDPLEQLQNTRSAVKHHINTLLNEMKGLKFVETLKITFRKVSNDETIEKNAYFNSTPQTIINNLEVAGSLESSKQQILNKIAQWVSEGSGWTIQSVNNHYINIVKYQPMQGSSYIQLPQELRNSALGLINLKNEDDECFRWCHIRYLNPQTKDPQRIKKIRQTIC